MSRCLADRSIDHVVLERGEVANTWKKERWDSLRLLTPNWQSRLPGFGYEGDAPDGFRTMPETIDFIQRYAEVISAPIQTDTTVTSVCGTDDGFIVATDQGDWRCRTVVIASGPFAVPSIPAVAEGVPSSIATLTPKEYRNPEQLEEGGVMVVGASASGTQIAAEIHRSGRPVTLALGEHIRAPRVYRGRDIKWWMDRAGVLDEFYTEIDNIDRVRSVPSLQLTGSDDRRTLDLNSLTDIGVKLLGRLAGINDGKAQFSGSLRNLCEMADLKMNRLLERIDEWATETGLDDEVAPPHRLEPTRVEASPPLGMDLESGEIRTILWATGFRPDHSWIDLPVFDRKGRIRHDGGVVEAPGMYLMGMPFLRRRKSSLIDGAGDDARDLSAHLAAYLDGKSPLPLPEERASAPTNSSSVPVDSASAVS
jgi:putative flavoprotein involved in K+ transport